MEPHAVHHLLLHPPVGPSRPLPLRVREHDDEAMQGHPMTAPSIPTDKDDEPT